MPRKAKRPDFKKFQPGDPVEIVWKDASTRASWVSHDEAVASTLATILTRGTLLAIRDDAIVVALDMEIDADGKPTNYHGVGVVELNSVAEIRKLRGGRKQDAVDG